MRRTVQRRVLNVLAAVDAIRERHPRLRAPATPRAVWDALDAERIVVRAGRIRRKARSSNFAGDRVITLRVGLAPREAWKWALHEWGHLVLHFPVHGEAEWHMSPVRAEDPREDEATLFALLLSLGPSATPDTPAVAAFVARMTTRELLEARPPQLALDMPEGPAPTFRPKPVDNKLLAAAYEDALGEHRRRRRPSRVRLFQQPARESEDLRRIRHYDEATDSAKFEDVAGRMWAIYNFAKVVVAGRRHWIRVRDFMSPDITHRLFVNAGGERRMYEFTDRKEARAYRVKHLDRQLAYAKTLKPRALSIAAVAREPARPGNVRKDARG